MTIGWRPASKRHDRERLKAFRCAPDGAPPYAQEVQRWFRSRAITLTNGAPGAEEAHLLLLFDGDELAGCVRHSRTAPLPTFGGVSARFIDYLAVSVNFQRARFPDGRRVSDVLLFVALGHAADVGTPTDAVAALVHPQNEPARRLLGRFGITSVAPAMQPPYDLWYGPWQSERFAGVLPRPISP